jgi:hypothetical protein
MGLSDIFIKQHKQDEDRLEARKIAAKNGFKNEIYDLPYKI